MAKHLNTHMFQSSITVKRNKEYSCLSNDFVTFLDITHYLAPGLGYVMFLKAFPPYKWFHSAKKLAVTALPLLGQAWYSTLKNKSVLESGINLPEVNYVEAQRTRTDQHMQTAAD